MNKYNEIRKVVTQSFSKHLPKDMFHLTSNLNWLRYEASVEETLKFIPKNAKVLDIGCGGGHVSAMLALRKDLTVIGFDSDPVYEPIWKDLRKFGAKLERIDALKLPFNDNSFDAVVSFGVMEHTDSDEKFLDEIYRVLKKGGYNFIFDLPNKYSFSEAFAAKLAQEFSRKKFFYHDRMYTERQAIQLISRKFTDISIKREHFIPAQVQRVSSLLGRFFDKNYKEIDKLDRMLIKTPLEIFAQNFTVRCRK